MKKMLFLLIIGAVVLVSNLVLADENQTSVTGDTNGDGCVDDDDLSLVLANWNKNIFDDCPNCNGDFNWDRIVDRDDLSLLLANWTGKC